MIIACDMRSISNARISELIYFRVVSIGVVVGMGCIYIHYITTSIIPLNEMSLKFLIIWRSLQARIKQKVSRRPEKGRETLMNAIH